MTDAPIIAGIDEAGRGALAGPVVAGACVLRLPLFRRRHATPRWSPGKRKRPDDIFIADSKLLTPLERERAYAWIIEHCAFGVGIVSHRDIDRRGILWATERAMRSAVEMLRTSCDVDRLIVDGRDHFRFDLPHTSVIRGDQTEPCIAAASIVAKCTRDRILRETASLFPSYRFAEHKGYGTATHIRMLREHGPCSFHRMSFLTSVFDAQERLPLGAFENQNQRRTPAAKSGIV